MAEKRGPRVLELGNITLSTQACGCTMINDRYRTNQITHPLSPSIVDVSFPGCPAHRGLPQGLVRWLCLLVPARTPRHDWMVGGEIRAQKKLNLRSLCTCANPTLRSQAPACLLHLGLPWRRGPKDKKVQTTGQTAQPASISSTRGGKPCNTIRFVQSRNAPAAQPGQAGPLASQTLTPRPSSHARPTLVHRHGRCAETVLRQSPRQHACRRGARQHTRRVSD